MNKKLFKAFFSIAPKDVRRTVVLSPIIYPKQFEKISGKKGRHSKSILSYLIVNFKDLTFIKTPMTQSAVSDLVQLLKGTKCKKIYFIGAIGGLAKGLKIGDVVLVNRPHYIHSVNSIHDETKKNLLAWSKKGKIGIDFENTAFFKATKKANLKPVACYVVTDLPLTKPFYEKKTAKQLTKIQGSIIQIILGVLEP
jgi:purine-nucleoside phosphorylase